LPSVVQPDLDDTPSTVFHLESGYCRLYYILCRL